MHAFIGQYNGYNNDQNREERKIKGFVYFHVHLDVIVYFIQVILGAERMGVQPLVEEIEFDEVEYAEGYHHGIHDVIGRYKNRVKPYQGGEKSHRSEERR